MSRDEDSRTKPPAPQHRDQRFKGAGKGDAGRKQRLAEALRANLKRRKQRDGRSDSERT